MSSQAKELPNGDESTLRGENIHRESPSTAVLHYPITESEEGEVLSLTHIKSRMYGVPVLPNKNIPRDNSFTSETLDAKPLAVALSSVLGTSTGFLMGHGLKLLPL